MGEAVMRFASESFTRHMRDGQQPVIVRRGAMAHSPCGHANPPDSLFCGECGLALQTEASCATCGRTNPPAVKFCHGCGTKLAAASTIPTTVTPVVSATPSSPTALVNGRYHIQRLLGEGSKKRVYLARDTYLPREVAVAVFKTDGLDDTGRKRIRRETHALSQLSGHPHIVTLYDAGSEGQQYYFISQYLTGGSLRDLLQQAEHHHLPLPLVFTLAEQMSQALEHVHQHGILHRDLEPSNVWLTQEGVAQLGDFDLAVALDYSQLSCEDALIDTAAYLPPEHLQGKKMDERSDLYSFGAMLYEMAAGRPPFVGDSLVSLIAQHLNAQPVAPSHYNAAVPPALDTLILQLLAKEPAARPQNATAVRTALREMKTASIAAAISSSIAPANSVDRSAIRQEASGETCPKTRQSLPLAVPSQQFAFRHKENHWTLTFQGMTCRLKNNRGLSYLAPLLAHPHQEFPAIELVARSAATQEEHGESGEVWTLRAKAEYQRRVQELREELEEAREFNDQGRIDKLEERMDMLTQELTRRVGGGGQHRHTGVTSERARVNVTMAIKSMIVKITTHHPALGRHLTCTIKTGAFCSYVPDPRVPVEWEIKQ